MENGMKGAGSEERKEGNVEMGGGAGNEVYKNFVLIQKSHNRICQRKSRRLISGLIPCCIRRPNN
jgi:hypothetical protein